MRDGGGGFRLLERRGPEGSKPRSSRVRGERAPKLESASRAEGALLRGRGERNLDGGRGTSS